MRLYPTRGSRAAALTALARAQDALATIDLTARKLPRFSVWRTELQTARSNIDRAGAIVASGTQWWHEVIAGVVFGAAITAGLAYGQVTWLNVPKIVAVPVALAVMVFAGPWPCRWWLTWIHAHGRRVWLRILPQTLPLPGANTEALLKHLLSTLSKAQNELRLAHLTGSGAPGDAWWAVNRAGPSVAAAWRATARIWGTAVENWDLTYTRTTEEIPDSDEVEEAGRMVAGAADRLNPLIELLSTLSTPAMVTWTTRLLNAQAVLRRVAADLRYETRQTIPATRAMLLAELGTVTASTLAIMLTLYELPAVALATVAAGTVSMLAPLVTRIVRYREAAYITRRSAADHQGQLGANLREIGQHIDLLAGEAKYEAAHLNWLSKRVMANVVTRIPWRAAAADSIANARAWVCEAEGAMRDYTKLS